MGFVDVQLLDGGDGASDDVCSVCVEASADFDEIC